MAVLLGDTGARASQPGLENLQNIRSITCMYFILLISRTFICTTSLHVHFTEYLTPPKRTLFIILASQVGSSTVNLMKCIWGNKNSPRQAKLPLIIRISFFLSPVLYKLCSVLFNFVLLYFQMYFKSSY